MLNLHFSPLLSFTIYFCFLHSLRHTFSLIEEIDNKNFRSGLTQFLKKAMLLTILTSALFFVSIFFLNKYYLLNSAILKVIFIGLASLTFPHILLEYLLEKNEK
jgi:Brp/Blh family beta-carotene 15,15'-monooxygenase